MTRDRARKAAVREHAEATASNYTRAAHTVAATGTATAPPEIWIQVEPAMGPNWGHLDITTLRSLREPDSVPDSW